MKKRRLGKGLSSLIGPSDTEQDQNGNLKEQTDGQRAGEPVEIDLAAIELNPQQPRKDIDSDALEGLAQSIEGAGVLQPIVVRPKGDMYELIMGERRMRAAHKAGLDTIPAFIRQVSDDRMLELALIENVQREDLNAIEKAEALHKMVEDLDMTQKSVGEKLGMNRSTVSNFLRLLELPAEIRDMVSRGTLSAGHARALLSVESEKQQLELARKVENKGLSVRQTEKLAARQLRPAQSSSNRAPSPQVKRLQRELQESLGTKVEIRNRGEKGKIMIHFSDNEQFERLYALMTGESYDQQSVA